MKRVLNLAGILIWLCVTHVAYSQPNSASPQGTWYKFKVSEAGIYHIGFDDLKKAGINAGNINPSQIDIIAMPTGMLPQPNSTPRPEYRSVAITVTGAEDGEFDKGDEIIFYGQGPDKYQFKSSKQLFAYENNLYSDNNFYFLRIDRSTGSKRVAKSSLQPASRTVVDQYVDFGYYENDQYNDQKSGRDWFGEQFDAKNEITIRFDMPGIIPNSTVRFVSNLMAQSYEYSYFKVSWNNSQILDRKMDTIPQTRYGSKGTYGIDTLTLNSNTIGASSATNQDIKINFTKGGGNRSVGYLNYILFTVNRSISMYKDVNFLTIPKQNQSESDIKIASFTSDGMVWDVTDPFNATELVASGSGDTYKVALATDVDRTLAVFRKDGLKTPEFVSAGSNNSIRGSKPSLVIVTHPDFLAEANRLAAHRESVYADENMKVQVVTTQQVYDEFSGGRQDVTAIRDFIRDIYKTQSTPTLKNLLLFGRGSYDYKNRVFNNSNFVPIYESRNSLEPLETYASDDYYGFLDDNEGQWSEGLSSDHTLDIGIGRLPVRTVAEAADAVDKLILYDKKTDLSAWKQKILFVADDGDGNVHQLQAENMAESFENLYTTYQPSKLYLDAFEQETIASGQISPKAKEALRLELDKGYDLINYTGHGSERVWMQERILDQDTPLKMNNGARLPLFITATCEFGRHDDPILTSTAEMLLLKKNGGAIGLVTTSRPVSSSTNNVLNKAFYDAYFEDTQEWKDLGLIFRKTKNQSLSGVANRNFSLLGDPSMRFTPSPLKVVVTSISTDDGSTVLKALSKVTITGEIRNGSDIQDHFNGTIDVELFDKRSQLITLGDESSPFAYKNWDHSLFRGKGKVVDGEFAIEFILPEGISDAVENGKLIMYSHTSDKLTEARGSLKNIKVGGVSASPPADVTGPSIELFMGDTTFVNGGYANSNTFLVGKLFDKHGMNISGYGDGLMKAVLDGTKTFVVNDYFVANEDDFTNGMFSFPVNDLEEGQHTISFTATDTYGNPGTASVSFIVGADGALVVESLNVYPNPFSETSPATIEFMHNRAGEDLEVQVAIYDLLGQLADKREFTVSSSTYRVSLFDWNGLTPQGTKMGNGIYVVKLAIRSVQDGAKNDKIAKLILSN